ncbi:Imm45 family immunity protein [Xylophilus sp. GOD-11R]|uniref:Imm45 family immunity protein n=1 Tax=Xylophilus sp. GOD-11R TaxID=3089814 RepID=UPI00298D160A|nr:Imm45 family immunity protein [Xylophilus sp. GOD-11R]WPB56635.1 Imm45 family immunity protein [Xylophilus sp. GOD-11R]
MARKKQPTIVHDKAWVTLMAAAEPYISRGAVFRCHDAKWPYESIVDFMLILDTGSPSGFALIVATGYKSGHVVRCLPSEARTKEAAYAISREWLQKNWNEWIYEECDLNKVLITNHYSIGM